MPKYEYFCLKCDVLTTERRRIVDKYNESECKVCGNKLETIEVSDIGGVNYEGNPNDWADRN